jgi:hypothetical protein
MQVMQDVETKDIKPKDIKVIEDKAAHQDAAVDKVSAKAHLSMWVELSPVSPHPKDDYSHLQYREGGFPKDIPEDIKAAPNICTRRISRRTSTATSIFTSDICSPRRSTGRAARTTNVS